MRTKQTIAVIGANRNMGSDISRSLSRGNYKLLLFANEPDQLKDLVQEIVSTNASADVEAIDCSVNASWEADIIILDIPNHTEKSIAEKIREVANQKIIISLSNSLHDTDNSITIVKDTSAAEKLQHFLPNSKVVKVFNTSFAHGISSKSTDDKKIVDLIAGNDTEALETVFGLLSIAGYNPVIAGRLTASRTLEKMQ
jgi:8-hydroxy-5-deazaflavin:NADPH oxidoreductase